MHWWTTTADGAASAPPLAAVGSRRPWTTPSRPSPPPSGPPRAAFHEPRPARLRARQPARDGQGRAVRALLALPGHAAPAVPRRVRRLAAGGARRAVRRRRGRARRAALRADLPRLRRRLGRPARRGARRVRVGLQRPDEGPPAPAAGAPTSSSPRATSPTTRRCPAAGYRYYRDPELGPEYERAMDELFAIYAAALPRVIALGRRDRSRGDPSPARTRAVQRQGAGPPARAAARRLAVAHGHLRQRPDLRAADPPPPRPPAARGAPLRPAGSSRRSRPSCRASSRASSGPTAAASGSRYLAARATRRPTRWVAAARASIATAATATRPARRCALLHVDGDEEALLAALLFEAAGAERGGHAHARWPPSGDERARAARRPRRRAANRRHRPGRGFEALRYRFEIVSDYGAFRDLQRHRMLTVQWQRLTPAPRRRRARGGRSPPAAATSTARARGLARPSGRASPAPATTRARRCTRCASATGSATCSTSTRARRCSSSSCAPGARAIRATARSRTRCTARSPQVHPAVAPR